MKYLGETYTRQQLTERVGDLSQLLGIRSLEGADGVERGLRMLRVWNAAGLDVDVLADRALDLGKCTYKGIPLSWISGTGYVHPSLLPQNGWPDGFHGGLLATCGLDNVGPSCNDEQVDYEQHGTIHRIPAREVRYETSWKEHQPTLMIEGTVSDRRSTGYHLQLVRRIEMEGDRALIRICDEVENLGIAEEPCLIQYHMNFGFPLVDEQTQLLYPQAVEHSRITVSELGDGPGVKRILLNEQSNQAETIVCNEKLGLQCTVRQSTSSLAHLWRWHDLRKGMHVLAIEPANCEVKPRSRAREEGKLITLKPGERLKFELEFEVEEIKNDNK